MRQPIDKRNKSNLMSQFVISSYKKFCDIAICDFTDKKTCGRNNQPKVERQKIFKVQIFHLD